MDVLTLVRYQTLSDFLHWMYKNISVRLGRRRHRPCVHRPSKEDSFRAGVLTGPLPVAPRPSGRAAMASSETGGRNLSTVATHGFNAAKFGSTFSADALNATPSTPGSAACGASASTLECHIALPSHSWKR